MDEDSRIDAGKLVSRLIDSSRLDIGLDHVKEKGTTSMSKRERERETEIFVGLATENRSPRREQQFD